MNEAPWTEEDEFANRFWDAVDQLKADKRRSGTMSINFKRIYGSGRLPRRGASRRHFHPCQKQSR